MTAQLPSRERLEALASGNAFTCIQDDEATAMARALLAAHEQEPYGYVHKAIYESTGSSGLTNDHAAYRGTDGSHVPVFLHPAPVHAVPDEIDIYTTDRYVMQYAKGWNACRAAMLNGGKS